LQRSNCGPLRSLRKIKIGPVGVIRHWQKAERAISAKPSKTCSAIIRVSARILTPIALLQSRRCRVLLRIPHGAASNGIQCFRISASPEIWNVRFVPRRRSAVGQHRQSIPRKIAARNLDFHQRRRLCSRSPFKRTDFGRIWPTRRKIGPVTGEPFKSVWILLQTVDLAEFAQLAD